MTKIKQLPEICRCACGRKAELSEGMCGWYVECDDIKSCWFGPTKKTARAAILEWNKTMDAITMNKRLIETLADVLHQAQGVNDTDINHYFISSYENACEVLKDFGVAEMLSCGCIINWKKIRRKT